MVILNVLVKLKVIIETTTSYKQTKISYLTREDQIKEVASYELSQI